MLRALWDWFKPPQRYPSLEVAEARDAMRHWDDPADFEKKEEEA